MEKLLGGLAGLFGLSSLILFVILKIKLKRAKGALKEKNAEITELKGFLDQRDNAITALESDLGTERAAAAGAIQEIRELRDDVSSCRSPAVVLDRFDRLLEELKAP